MKYAIHFWYHDNHNEEQSGTHYVNDLIDVFAYCDMVKRHGGWARCNIGTINA